MEMTGKVAVVTGASSGIGAATARALAARGAALVLADIDRRGLDERLQEIAASGGVAVGVPADIGVEEDLERVFTIATEHFGGVDVLHNNAFPIHLAPRDRLIHDADAGAWNEMMAVAVTGTVMATKLAVRSMLARGGGSIINTASISGMVGDARGNPCYAACKAAIMSVTRSTATLYGKRGVRCNSVSPGHIQTPPLVDAFGPALERILEHYPSPRLGIPEDIANVVLFLASDAAAFVNGHNLVADGGLTVPMATFADYNAEHGDPVDRPSG